MMVFSIVSLVKKMIFIKKNQTINSDENYHQLIQNINIKGKIVGLVNIFSINRDYNKMDKILKIEHNCIQFFDVKRKLFFIKINNKKYFSTVQFHSYKASQDGKSVLTIDNENKAIYWYNGEIKEEIENYLWSMYRRFSDDLKTYIKIDLDFLRIYDSEISLKKIVILPEKMKFFKWINTTKCYLYHFDEIYSYDIENNKLEKELESFYK